MQNANNGKELGRSTTNQLSDRPDLAAAMPNILIASQAGFNTGIDLAPGMGDQAIRVISWWSTRADANTDYVDYWFAPQTLYNDFNNNAWQ